MKKLLSILMSVMFLTSLIITPIYADETENNVIAKQETEKITDIDTIFTIISNYLKENDVYARAEKSDYLTDYMVVAVCFYYVDNKAMENLEDYIEEQNIDKNMLCIYANDMTMIGDINNDGYVTVRDYAEMTENLAKRYVSTWPSDDFNEDEKNDVRDAAAINQYLAKQ